ncbi:unnamed protein product, partial [Didymodactylos carnosus]
MVDDIRQQYRQTVESHQLVGASDVNSGKEKNPQRYSPQFCCTASHQATVVPQQQLINDELITHNLLHLSSYCPKVKSFIDEEQLNELALLGLEEFASSPFAILYGETSTNFQLLATSGLQKLVKSYTSPTEWQIADRPTAWEIIKPHFWTGPPRIRFEGVFDIIQQYIDPNLSVLDILNSGTSRPSRTHDALAVLAFMSTVVTTNFDHLIEDAGRYRPGYNPNTVPFNVFYTEADFGKARNSLGNSASSIPEFKGLWKIHGTVARWENNSWSLVRADEDGGPVATFRHLSSTRES